MNVTFANAPWKRVSWGKPREWRTYWGWTLGGQKQYRNTEEIVLQRDCKRVDSATVGTAITGYGSALPTPIYYGGGQVDTLSGATPFQPDSPEIKDSGSDHSTVTVKWTKRDKTWTDWP